MNRYTADVLQELAGAIMRQAMIADADVNMIEVWGHGLTVFAYLDDGRVLVADVLVNNERCDDELRNILRNLLGRLLCVPP